MAVETVRGAQPFRSLHAQWTARSGTGLLRGCSLYLWLIHGAALSVYGSSTGLLSLSMSHPRGCSLYLCLIHGAALSVYISSSRPSVCVCVLAGCVRLCGGFVRAVCVCRCDVSCVCVCIRVRVCLYAVRHTLAYSCSTDIP